MSDRIRPPGCSCPGDYWHPDEPIGPICDAFDYDGQGECLRCEHFGACHAAKAAASITPERRRELEKMHDDIRDGMCRAFGLERIEPEGESDE